MRSPSGKVGRVGIERPAEDRAQTVDELRAWEAANAKRSAREAAAALAETRARAQPVTLKGRDPGAPASLAEAL